MSGLRPFTCADIAGVLSYHPMASRLTAKSEYQKGLARFGNTWTPNWPPSDVVAVGAVGVVENGRFQRLDTLESFRVPFEVDEGRRSYSFDHQSDEGVTVITKLRGRAAEPITGLGEADLGFRVEFSKSGALLLSVRKSHELHMTEQIRIQAALEDLSRKKLWRKNWLLITDVLESESATVLVAGSAKASISLLATGSVQVEQLHLAGIEAGLKRVSTTDIATEVIAEAGFPLAYRAIRVKRSVTGKRTAGRAPAKKAVKRRAPAKKAAKRRAPAKKAAKRRAPAKKAAKR